VLRGDFGGQIDVAYEGVGGELQQTAWECLAPGGRMLVVGYISEYPHAGGSVTGRKGLDKLPPSEELFWGGRTVGKNGRIAYGNVWPADRKDTLQAKKSVFHLYDSGQLSAWVDERRFGGIQSVTSAVDNMLQGKALGKVVVDIQKL